MTRALGPFWFALFAATVTIAACSGDRSRTGSGAEAGAVGSGGGPPGTGEVVAFLTLASGAQLNSLDWTISGPNAYAGRAAFGDAEAVKFVAGAIAAGTGYAITLTGTDTGGHNCTGTSSPFDVTAGALVEVVLIVACVVPTDASTPADTGGGTVLIESGIEGTDAGPCPGISSLSINPVEVQPGQLSNLRIATVGPSPVVHWTANPAADVSFSDPTSLTPTLRCTVPLSNPAQVTISVQVGLADSGACSSQQFTSLQAIIQCDRCSTPCDAGQATCSACVCTLLASDPANCGACGHACPAGKPCVNSACAP